MTSQAKPASMYGPCSRCGKVRAINPRRGDLCSSCRHFSTDLAPGDWARDGACTTVDPEIFFGDSRDHPFGEAIAVCSTCPVIDQCLDYAITANIRYGVWGGLTPSQRQQMSRAS